MIKQNKYTSCIIIEDFTVTNIFDRIYYFKKNTKYIIIYKDDSIYFKNPFRINTKIRGVTYFDVYTPVTEINGKYIKYFKPEVKYKLELLLENII